MTNKKPQVSCEIAPLRECDNQNLSPFELFTTFKQIWFNNMRISTCFPARQGFLSGRRQFDKTGAPALAPTDSTQTCKWVKVAVRDDGARGGADGGGGKALLWGTLQPDRLPQRSRTLQYPPKKTRIFLS